MVPVYLLPGLWHAGLKLCLLPVFSTASFLQGLRLGISHHLFFLLETHSLE